MTEPARGLHRRAAVVHRVTETDAPTGRAPRFVHRVTETDAPTGRAPRFVHRVTETGPGHQVGAADA